MPTSTTLISIGHVTTTAALALALAASLGANPARAAGMGAAGSPATQPHAASMADQRPDGHRFRSGGIGQASQQAMREAADDYSLGLSFSRAADGAYLGDVDLEILNAQGQTVLDRQDAHPMVLVDLPAGRYTVVATFDGRTQRQAVQVPDDGHERVVLSW
ncbi:MAG: carboxypeptidase regulatory-like domain-containing protein [Hydrogenophaga sp.]|uniref:carboxypeptidase regulatory-like domain-containing protein n=1 Tax=Hydrogenophaga sp. TaxID=1904254 RepID=UPI00169FF29B|nr:carboxypeptidase regulatory-like domain-containing protein [Hydrogenophaga sp.]NIM39884.1 carboxypeptidase regulatory-like domain-containing protein [Hydrogenophaga sp.]NIN25080.1 carboxypeptidase regulatory-like domain-containing protein [Hydrogenophaga sp.]NIN29647.1 carboxypeptidase regulatory-like domain-containing protein [Hydrogenophaga sp.]NIN54119.1 carboxypeptidase regulatory-like domain-containing protein [Hydrogenophaga sp.]NIO50532.1 carboxypeptidase regulatory-like domain-conta